MRKKTSTAFSMILPIKYDSSFSFELGSSFASKFLKYQFDKYATWSSNPSAPRNLSSSFFFFSCDQKSNVESFQKNREYFISKRSQDKSSNDWVIVLKVSPIFIDALLYIYFSALKIVVLFKTQLPNNFFANFVLVPHPSSSTLPPRILTASQYSAKKLYCGQGRLHKLGREGGSKFNNNRKNILWLLQTGRDKAVIYFRSRKVLFSS